MNTGFLVINKPAGITSHDVVAIVRAVTGVKKVGHTGTLDPFATGVLPLALGPCTRLIQYLDESIKVYDACIKLGEATDTGDPTGEVIRQMPVPEITDEHLAEVLKTFLGERMQEPPAYSAVKVKGKPLYHYARKGEKVRAKPRPITIHDLEVLGRAENTITVRITCSRGTYARVLADEIAIALGTAGHLLTLSRARSGPFFIEDALDIQTLSSWVAEDPEAFPDWKQVLRGKKGDRVKWKPRDDVRAKVEPLLVSPLSALSHLPIVEVDSDRAKRIRNGAMPPPPPKGVILGGRYAVVMGSTLLAIAENHRSGPKALLVVSNRA